jgi:hypothetical protein
VVDGNLRCNAGYDRGSRSRRDPEDWCRRGESNPRPRDYETLALPLSYAGIRQFFMLRTHLRGCQGVVPGSQLQTFNQDKARSPIKPIRIGRCDRA